MDAPTEVAMESDLTVESRGISQLLWPFDSRSSVPFRLNLVAVDRWLTRLFVARRTCVTMHRLGASGLLPEPGVIVLQHTRVVNSIRIGRLGALDALASADDVGDVQVLLFDRGGIHRVIQLSNMLVSTWGIALCAPRSLLAVSANNRRLSFFEFASDAPSGSVPASVVSQQTDGTYLTFFERGLHEELDEEEKSRLSSRVGPTRLGSAPLSDNTPSIDFSPKGRFMVTISIDASVLLLDLSASEVIARGSLDEDWGWGVRMIPRSQVRGSTRQKSGEQEEERDDFLLIFTSDSALIVADMELNGLAAYPLEESSARATIHMAIFLFIPELSLIVLRPRNEMVFIRITADDASGSVQLEVVGTAFSERPFPRGSVEGLAYEAVYADPVARTHFQFARVFALKTDYVSAFDVRDVAKEERRSLADLDL